LTGVKVVADDDIEIDPAFKETMKEISNTLCGETESFIQNNGGNSTLRNQAYKLYNNSLNATREDLHYSAASYCFGANVIFQKLELRNMTDAQVITIYENITNEIKQFNDIIDAIELKTVSDLQTYMIVKERIKDAETTIGKIEITSNITNNTKDIIGYAVQRYKSAVAWSRFFATGTVEFRLDKEVLQQTCINKIAEVRSYTDYVRIYINLPLNRIEEQLVAAWNDFDNGDYELCIFKASKAKAESTLVLEALNIDRDNMEELLEEKFILAQKTIASVQKKGIFPILGYSYYEYANSLKDYDMDSAILYIGYANEMSNINVYFENKENDFSILTYLPDSSIIYAFLFGLLIGVGLILIYNKKDTKKKKSRKK